jgi:hypothetical protein
MMAREQRASTLIDPASLKTRPTTQRLSSYGSLKPQQTLSRQNSLSMKPLLNFEDEDGKGLQPPVAGRLPTSRSVFGVDTLWEREMTKLKEIETREAREKEERLKLEKETERKSKKNKRKKKSRKPKDDENVQQVPVDAQVLSVEPPTLPNIQRATRTVPPMTNVYDDSSESEEERVQPRPSATWHESSSDEDNAGPRRTTGVGLRYPKPSHKISISHDDDSEEDLPLAATIHKAAARAALGVTQAGSDDEDRPLSHIILQAKAKLPPPSSTRYAENQAADDDDDDDQPLGLRASRFIQSRPNADDEDDVPLAFHPEQQRRTQYQMLAQQQHQQQMMMQAQMQSNMLMSASMMGPGYFAPLVHPMGMMQVPMPIPSPPPMNDEVKFGRVDRWRRDIVVDE